MAKAGGRQEAEQLIGDLLLQHKPAVTVSDAQFAAQQFLQMVVSLPQLRAMGLGAALSDLDLEDWTRRTVRLFIQGWNMRDQSPR